MSYQEDRMKSLLYGDDTDPTEQRMRSIITGDQSEFQQPQPFQQSFPQALSLYEPDEKLTVYDDYINKALASNQSTVDKNLIYRMMKQESGGNPNAYSPAGAKGLLQLMPETAESLGVTDRADPEQNINGAVKLVTQLMQKYNGDQKKVLAAYNGGESGVDKATKAYGDAWLEHLDEFKGTNNTTGRNHAEETWAYINAIEADVPSGPQMPVEDNMRRILGILPQPAEEARPARNEYVSRETPLQPQEAPKRPSQPLPQELPDQQRLGAVSPEYVEKMGKMQPLLPGYEMQDKLTPEQMKQVAEHQPKEPMPEITKEDKKKLAEILIDTGNEHLLGKIVQMSAAFGKGVLQQTPGVGTVLGKKFTESPMGEALTEKYPVSAVAGGISSNIIQALGGGAAVGKVLGGVLKSPTAVNALTRAITTGGTSALKQDWEKDFVGSALNTLQGAGAGAVSVVPEIFGPANALQLLLQPAAGAVWDVGIDLARGRTQQAFKTPEERGAYIREKVLNAALDLGFAIKDVASGQEFKTTQQTQRAEINSWLGGKGEKGFDIKTEGMDEKKIETAVANMRKAFEKKDAEELENRFPDRKEVPVIEGEGEFKPAEIVGTLEGKRGTGYKPTEDELAKLPQVEPIKETAAEVKVEPPEIVKGEGYKPTEEELAKLPEPEATPAKDTRFSDETVDAFGAPKTPEWKLEQQRRKEAAAAKEDKGLSGLPIKGTEALQESMFDIKNQKPPEIKPIDYSKATKDEIVRHNKDISKEQEVAFREYESNKEKIETELAENEFTTDLRQRIISRLGFKERTGDQWKILTEGKTRDKAGNLITRDPKIEAELQTLANSWNQAKTEGRGSTMENVPPERILNKVDNWSTDDVQELLTRGMTLSDFNKYKATAKGRLNKLESDFEMAGEDFGRRGESIASRMDELGVKSEGVSKSVDEYLDDFAPPVGFSIRDVSKTKSVDDNVKVPEGFDKDFEGAYQKAHGLQRPAFAEKVRGAVTKIKNAFTRHNPLLDPGKYAAENEILRQQDVVNEVSQVEAANITRGITAGLGPKMYNAFEHNVILPDLMKDIEGGLYEGKKLPLNLRDTEHAKAVHDQWQKVAELNPAIKQAVEKRTGFMRAIRKEMVDNNLLPAKVLEDDRYFHHQVLEYMAINESVSGGKGLQARRHGYQRSRIGAANAYNTDYIQSEYEVLSKMLAQLRTKQNIARLMNSSDITEKIRAEAKEKGVKPETLIPEGYETWQPEKGNVFYQTNSISDKVVNDVLVEGKVLTEEDISVVNAMGGKKKEYIIPTELKKTLEGYSKLKDDNVLGKYSKAAMDAWKQWTLLNPQGVLKYNLNNTSGDLDIAFAYKPSIVFNEAFKAAKDLAPSGLAGKAPSREIMKAMEKGVLNSGFSGKEIGEISENEFFKNITGKDPNVIEKYWGGVKKFTTYRENILRLAAYRHFQKEIAAGKRPVGVSKKNVMEGLYKSIDEGKMEADDAAARLARDLIGDYGNISQAGQFLRSHVMPFYSWMEINAPRYIRLVQNLPAEERGAVAGRLAGVAAKKGAAFAGKTAIRGGALAAKAAGLSVLINLWNHTFFPDEEKEMGRSRRELHLITGRNKETGEIRSVRFQGALADLLNWVGAADIHHDIGDVVSGKATVGDKVKEAGKSALSKIVNSLGPQLKLPVELATKKTLYPDFSKPRPIRDRGEYVAKTFSVDLPYRVFSGKPLRGIKDEAMASIVYKTDPGEQAYFDSKAMIGDFMRKKGSDASTFEPSNRSNALYYYKKAISYGDDRAADRWLKRYKKIGGTDKGIFRSIRYAAPYFGVENKYKSEFYNSLTPEEKETFDVAEKWYNKIYYKK